MIRQTEDCVCFFFSLVFISMSLNGNENDDYKIELTSNKQMQLSQFANRNWLNMQ